MQYQMKSGIVHATHDALAMFSITLLLQDLAYNAAKIPSLHMICIFAGIYGQATVDTRTRCYRIEQRLPNNITHYIIIETSCHFVGVCVRVRVCVATAGSIGWNYLTEQVYIQTEYIISLVGSLLAIVSIRKLPDRPPYSCWASK